MSHLLVPVAFTSNWNSVDQHRGLQVQRFKDEWPRRLARPSLGRSIDNLSTLPLDMKFSAELRKPSAQGPPQLAGCGTGRLSHVRIGQKIDPTVGGAIFCLYASRVQGCLHRRTAKAFNRSCGGPDPTPPTRSPHAG